MRKTITFVCNKDLWERAKYELPMSRSKFIENQLRAYLDGELDSTQILTEKINKKQVELELLNQKLDELNKKKERQMKNKHLFDKSMDIVDRIVSIHGKIGISQLRNIAKQQDVPFEEFVKHCNENSVNIVEKFELPS